MNGGQRVEKNTQHYRIDDHIRIDNDNINNCVFGIKACFCNLLGLDMDFFSDMDCNDCRSNSRSDFYNYFFQGVML